jgi:integrase
MIEAAPNLMHRTILMVLYATGIRRAEVSLLKVSDIDSERMVIHILQGKASRDRNVPMTPRLLEALGAYFPPRQRQQSKAKSPYQYSSLQPLVARPGYSPYDPVGRGIRDVSARKT